MESGQFQLAAHTGNTGGSYDELLYIRRKYTYKGSLRRAIAKVVNTILNIPHPDIWGEGTTACTSDTQKSGAWDQNLMTEWYIRYMAGVPWFTIVVTNLGK